MGQQRADRTPQRSVSLDEQIVDIQGGFEYSEGASAEWIFDVEIKKLRAEIFLTCR